MSTGRGGIATPHGSSDGRSGERLSRRLAPKKAGTVAVHPQGLSSDSDPGLPETYGVIVNVSESGICLATDRELAATARHRLRLSFYQQEILEAVGRVVWSRRSEGSGSLDRLHLHGLQFVELDPPQRARLQGLLDSGDFDVIFAPRTGELDDLLRSIEKDLELLGRKVDRSLGRRDS